MTPKQFILVITVAVLTALIVVFVSQIPLPTNPEIRGTIVNGYAYTCSYTFGGADCFIYIVNGVDGNTYQILETCSAYHIGDSVTIRYSQSAPNMNPYVIISPTYPLCQTPTP